MESRVPAVRLHIWLETSEGVYFGMGRAMLLLKIEEHGSLRKAAEDLGMSYRAAWGKLRKTEAILGVRLIENSRSKRDGCRLTEDGRRLMEKFFKWFEEVERTALDSAREIFPWSVQKFDRKSGSSGK
jgi:molybdate transport system regulatory protein